MLVVETDGEAPVRRATAAEVKQRLVSFYNRSGSDATYLNGENPLNFPINPRFIHGSDNEDPICFENQRRWSTIAGPNNDTKSSSPLRPNEVHVVGRRSTTDGTSDSLPLFQQVSGPTFFSETSSGLASTSSSDLSHSLVTATQMTQDTMSGDTKDTNSPFACPFFKRDPRKYGKTCSRGWTQFHRLKLVPFFTVAHVGQAANYLEGSIYFENTVFQDINVLAVYHVSTTVMGLRDTYALWNLANCGNLQKLRA